MNFLNKLFKKAYLLAAQLWNSQEEEYINYQNEEYLFSFKIPHHWKKSKMSIMPNSVVNYYDRMGYKYCYVYVEEKSNYKMKATLQDFAAIELSSFKSYEAFELKSMQLIEKNDGHFLLYEISFFYMNMEYIGYLSYHENEKTFYELGVIVQEGKKEANDYEVIINSFEVLQKLK